MAWKTEITPYYSVYMTFALLLSTLNGSEAIMSIESKHHLLTLVKRESICFSLQQAEVNATAHVMQRNTIKFLGRIVSGREKFKTL